jgi:hypothetical protein
MCVVSNIGVMGREMWPYPWSPQTYPAQPAPYTGPTREQFEEFLELMRVARKFDVATGQKDCPAEDKIKWMRELAQFLGLDPAKVDEVLK